MTLEFERMNFFHGLATEAEDWKKDQAYYLDKRKLHNRASHTRGIVQDEGDGLEVTFDATTNRITVGTGYALDAEGNDIYLANPVPLNLSPSDLSGPDKTVFVYIRFAEEKNEDTLRRNEFNGKPYEGHAFIREYAQVAYKFSEPDNAKEIELARFKVSNGRLAEKDTRRVLRSGARGASLAAYFEKLVSDLEQLIAPLGPGTKGTQIRITAYKTAEEAARNLHFANVTPLVPTDGLIQWRICSNLDAVKGPEAPAGIGIFLVIENHGTKEIRVRYEAYRLNVSKIVS